MPQFSQYFWVKLEITWLDTTHIKDLFLRHFSSPNNSFDKQETSKQVGLEMKYFNELQESHLLSQLRNYEIHPKSFERIACF